MILKSDMLGKLRTADYIAPMMTRCIIRRALSQFRELGFKLDVEAFVVVNAEVAIYVNEAVDWVEIHG